jgi:N-methylhydantoinase A
MDRIGIDTGGTFTDIAWISNGALKTAKVPSTPDNPARAVLNGIEKVGESFNLLCHGTTVGTNAILSRSGGMAGMVVSKGFADVLELGRGDRKNLYSLNPRRHVPLIERENIFEINLRLDKSGTAILSPGESEIEKIAEELKKTGMKSVAVGMIHSGQFPDEEISLGQKLSELTGLNVFTSSALTSYPREYERWSLASIAAYLSPVLDSYIRNLSGEIKSNFALMNSSGGLISGESANRNPAACVLSGPAGGAYAARLTGRGRVLALDMGGTSTDVTMITGNLPRTRESEIDGIPYPMPAMDIHTIGAGGGSIVKIDSGGMLKLGPGSAGADPGPACYGNGGPLTLTDIAMLSGRIVKSKFLGGKMSLDERLSERAFSEVCPDGMKREDFLEGVIELTKIHLVGALRKISVARGIDPSRSDKPFTLVPFGGAGAVFAVECARELGIREVIHPCAAGVYSAVGLLAAPISVEKERALLVQVDGSNEILNSVVENLKSDVEDELSEWGGTGSTEFSVTCECRYVGQSHALEIELVNPEDLKIRYKKAYAERYTYLHSGTPVELVTVRVRGEIAAPPINFPELTNGNRNLESSKIATQEIFIDKNYVDCPVYDRYLLPVGERINGPGIIADDYSTVYLPPDCSASMNSSGHLEIDIE